MDEAENTTGGSGTTDAAKDAARAAALEMKADAARTMNELKSGGIGGIFNFKHFYFPVVARVLWILSLVIMFVVGVIMILRGFSNGIGIGIASLIGVPIAVFIYALMIRVWFEMVVVLFRINDGIQEMNRKMK